MALLKPDFLMKHPLQSGLLWTVLFFLSLVLLNLILTGELLDNLSARFLLAVPAGIAWGYTMRWWHKRKLDAAR